MESAVAKWREASLSIAVVAAMVGWAAPAQADGYRGKDGHPSWTGFYLGAHAGFAWSGVSGIHDSVDVDGPFNFSNIDLDGALGGVQARYSFQTGQIVLGAEVDYSWAHRSDRAQGPDAPPGENFYHVKGGDLWSVRGVLGFTPISKLLVYGTVGWGESSFKLTVHDNFDGRTGSISLRENGLVYGGGIELALSDSVSIKTEYLHYDVGGRRNLTDPPVPDSNGGDFIKFDDVDVWRVGVNLKLGGWRREAAPLK
jgi:outer membrane immunogenic protein